MSDPIINAPLPADHEGAIDPTDRAHALRASFDRAALGLSHTSLEGRWLLANERFCAMVGYSEAELRERTFRDITHPDDLPANLDTLQRMASNQIEAFSMDKRYIRKDGSLIWVHVTVSLIRKPSGEPDYLLAVTEDINDRKRIELLLTRLGKIVDQSDNEIYIFDAQTLCFIQVNEGARQNLGYSMDELARLTPLDLKPELSVKQFAALLKPLRTGKQSQIVFEAMHRRKNGSLYPVEVRLHLSDGEQPVFVAITQDISKRKRIEEVLRAGQTQLRNVIDSLFSFVAVLTPEGLLVEVNRAALAVANLTPEQVLGKPFEETYWWSYSPQVQAQIRATIERAAAGEISRYDATARIAEDRYLIVDFAIMPMRDPSGKITYLIPSGTDVTERTHTETALRQSEDRYRSLAIASAQMIWTTLPSGAVEDMPSWREFTGQTIDEVRGWGWLNAVHPADRPLIEQAWGQAIATKGLYSVIYRLRRADGVYRSFAVRGVPVLEPNGAIREWVGTCTDITEHHQAEQALRFIAEASSVAVRSLDYAETLATLAQIAVPQVADYCMIHTLMDDGSIKLVAVAHIDPAKVALIWELERLYPIDPHDLRGLPLVIASGETEIVPEVLDTRLAWFANDHEHLEMLQSLGMRSSMCLPLVARGHTRGAITFMLAESERHYSASDAALVEEFARRAALALDNARLYEAEQQARRAAEDAAARTERLQAVTAALSQAITPAEVIDVVLTQGVTATGAYAGAVVLLNEADSTLRLAGQRGYAPQSVTPWQSFPLSTPVSLTEAIRQRVPVYLSRAEMLARFPTQAAATSTQTGGTAAIPLVVGDRVLGGLSLSLSVDRSFSPEERVFLEALAGQCAQALERSRLYEVEQQIRQAAEQAAARTERLQAVTAALSEALTPEQVAAVVVDQGLSALDAKASIVVLLSDDGTMLDVIGSIGYPRQVMAQWQRFPVDQPVPLAEAVRTGEPVWLASLDERVQRYPHLAEVYAASSYEGWISLPMKVESRVIGGISWSFADQHTLNDQERDFMLALAGQCAQAIMRAQLYEAERTARTAAELAQQRLAFLAEASAGLATSLDYATTLANLARFAVPRLADMCLVDVIEHDQQVHRVAVAHRDPLKEALAQEIARRYPPMLKRTSLLGMTLTENRSLVLETVPESTVVYIVQSDEHRALLEALGPQRSLMLVSLVARGRVFGALTFVISETERVYTQADLTLAEDLARRAALAIDNAWLYHEAEQEIAQRKQTQAELRRSEEQLRLITEALPVLISYVDAEHRYRFNNKAYEERFGRPRAELTGKHLRDVLSEPVYTELLPYIHAALSGETVTFQSRTHYVGGWRDVETTYIPDIGPQGTPVGFVVLVNDITESKRSEQSQRFLAEASALLAASLDYETTLASVARLAVPQLADWCTVDMVNDDGMIRRLAVAHVDPQKVALAEELRRRFPPDPHSPYGVAQVLRTGKAQLTAEITDEMLTALIPDDKSELLEITRALGLRSSMLVPLITRGRTVGVMTFVAAESDRRYSERDLVLAEDLAHRAALAVDNAGLYRASQEAVSATMMYAEQLRGLTQAALAINAALSLNQVLDIVTAQARTLIGAHQAVSSFTSDSNLSQAINTISLSERYAAWHDYATLPDGSGIYMQVCRTNKPMRLTQAELESHPAWRGFSGEAAAHPSLRGWLAAPLIGRGGRNIGLIQLSDKYTGEFTESDEAILVQLAQMASVAIENARLYQDAQEAILIRDDFLSIASHELKTPLTSLQLQAQSLLRQAHKGNLTTVAPERLVSKLELIDQQATRLTKLANDLLDVARIRAGRIDFRLEELDIASVVQEVVERFEEQFVLAGCSVELRADTPVLALSDRLRIEQVITNLLSNALKYGAGNPIEIVVAADAENAQITIQDHGIGIAPEHLERIFVRFERAVSARNYGGLGLGLYIVRQIVESLGGTIRVASEPEVGSVFTVTLPLVTTQR